MRKLIIKRIKHELKVIDNDQIFIVGPGYVVEVDSEGKPIDLLEFTPPSQLKGKRLAPILEKYSYLEDGKEAEEIIKE